MIKNLSMCIVSLLMACLLCAVAVPAMAMDQCEVVGNSYTLTLCGDEYTLANFVGVDSMFGPAPLCKGTVYLFSPNDTYCSFEWNVSRGNELTIGGFSAVLTEDGLVVYFIPDGLYTTVIGDVTYKTEQEIPTLQFE